jgi:Uma2 family endonuclease
MIAEPITQSTTNLALLSGAHGWPQQGEWDYAAYLRLPDDGRRYEIIEGILYVANAPGYDHQFTVTQLTTDINLFVRQNPLGVALTAPFEVHLSTTSRPVQPDVFFLNNEQKPIPAAQIFSGAPTLVVEVISPSSIRLDRHIKFDAYETAGVNEYWLVDLKTRSVEVYTLARGEYALFNQFTGDEQIESLVPTGVAIQTSSLFTT